MTEENKVKFVTVQELAKIQAEMESLQKDMAGALENSMASPEYLALDVAREELDRKDAQYRKQEDWKEYEGYVKEMAKLSEDWEAKVADYKALKLALFQSNPEAKNYDGGGIQVRKKLVIGDPHMPDTAIYAELLAEALAYRNLFAYLKPDLTLMAKDFKSNETLERMGFPRKVVSYQDKPVATLDGDLSKWIEDKENV